MSVAKTKPNKSGRRRSGRPTKEQAEELTEHIIDVATRLFLEVGFETTSVDLIAATTRISKQTFYARFVSKDALLSAVIRKRVNDLLMPVIRAPGDAGPIETTLVRIAFELSKRGLAPTAVAIDRLIASEAHQYPQLALTYQESRAQTRCLIAEILSNAMREDQLRAADAHFLAEQFQYALIDGPTRALILSGQAAISDKDLHDRIVAAVGLFLDGCRGRPASRHESP